MVPRNVFGTGILEFNFWSGQLGRYYCYIIKEQFKGGESSSQFQCFTIAKIEL